MIISSWNVNSVRARIENIKSYLLKYKPDVVMMQEIKTEDVNFPYDDFSSMDYESHVFGQKSYNGVAIISKGKLKNVKTKKLSQKKTLHRKNLSPKKALAKKNLSRTKKT
jgi:exodeoxyribonuclease-3